ncbi:hypothetical protein D6T69_13270 [Tenacibaculum singaporense]|uniref:Uncharacterized protein n=1 Tax=Tenacibaculum singaporense TaxID=2358479 RepID=A0A3Q8RPJ6_9FLAO|nr:hypothetical protein [Tenacibaculum singaporense]AZJ36438.1 hypothetical protein D6T69_13270 [Tenacibaculum singaporense]
MEKYIKLDSGEVIKQIRHVCPEKEKIYAKTIVYYNNEGVAYKITEWVQNKDKSITYNSRDIPHFNCFGELKLQ